MFPRSSSSSSASSSGGSSSASSSSYDIYASSPSTFSSTSLITVLVQRHPVRTASCCTLYLLGIGLLTLYTGYASSPELMEQYYERLPQKQDLITLNNNLFDMEEAYQKYYSSKGWFFTCDTTCTQNYNIYIQKKQQYDRVHTQHQQKISDAKATLGIFSETAIDETKNLFTQKVQGGTHFIKTQSKWDIFYSLLFRGISWSSSSYRDDDSGMIGWVIDIIFRITMNVIMGTIGVVVSFLVSVWSIITAYQASYLETFIFYTGAFLAVLSFGVTVCFGCCGLAVASIAVPVSMVINSNRLENGRYAHQPQQPRRYLHSHYE